MINKVAKLLLNSIQEKKPKHIIFRIAKVLYKLAYDYKEVMVLRFLEMLGHIPEDILVRLITTDAEFNVGTVKEKMSPQKMERLTAILSRYRVEKIADLADKIIEASPELKKKLAEEYKTRPSTIEIVTPSQGTYYFNYIPTAHFAHRKYLRDVSSVELKKVLTEYSIALLADYPEATKKRRSSEKEGGYKVSYISKIRKDNKNLNIVSGTPTLDPRKKIFTISMITIFANKDPSTIPHDFDGYSVSRETKEKPVVQKPVIQEPIKPRPKAIVHFQKIIIPAVIEEISEKQAILEDKLNEIIEKKEVIEETNINPTQKEILTKALEKEIVEVSQHQQKLEDKLEDILEKKEFIEEPNINPTQKEIVTKALEKEIIEISKDQQNLEDNLELFAKTHNLPIISGLSHSKALKMQKEMLKLRKKDPNTVPNIVPNIVRKPLVPSAVRPVPNLPKKPPQQKNYQPSYIPNEEFLKRVEELKIENKIVEFSTYLSNDGDYVDTFITYPEVLEEYIQIDGIRQIAKIIRERNVKIQKIKEEPKWYAYPVSCKDCYDSEGILAQKGLTVRLLATKKYNLARKAYEIMVEDFIIDKI